MTADYYRILGVQESATEKDIKKAYHSLAKQHHPDKCPNDPTAEARFKQIKEAFETLYDANRRIIYNSERSKMKANSNSTGNATRMPYQNSTFRNFTDETFKTHTAHSEATFQKSNQTKHSGRTDRSFPTHPRPTFVFTNKNSDHCSSGHGYFDNFTDKIFAAMFHAMFNTRQQPNHKHSSNQNFSKKAPRSAPKASYQRRFTSFEFDPFQVLFEESRSRHSYKHFQNGKKSPKFADEENSFFTDSDKEEQSEEEEEIFGFSAFEKPPFRSAKNANAVVSCKYCKDMFTVDELISHLPTCLWRATTPPSDTDPSFNFHMSDEEEEVVDYWSRDPHWRHKHAATQEAIRRDRSKRHSVPKDSPSANANLITCATCQRAFNPIAARSHIPFCQRKFKEAELKKAEVHGKSKEFQTRKRTSFSATSNVNTPPVKSRGSSGNGSSQFNSKREKTPENRNKPERNSAHEAMPSTFTFTSVHSTHLNRPRQPTATLFQDRVPMNTDKDSEEEMEDDGSAAFSPSNYFVNSSQSAKTSLNDRRCSFPIIRSVASTGRRRLGSNANQTTIHTDNSSGTPHSDTKWRKSSIGVGCPNCQKQYGLQNSSFTCSCGVKRHLQR